jgi:hypothetical protein
MTSAISTLVTPRRDDASFNSIQIIKYQSYNINRYLYGTTRMMMRLENEIIEAIDSRGEWVPMERVLREKMEQAQALV